MNTKRGAAALSIFSNLMLVILKLAVGLFSGSVSVISEAAHSGIDLIASLIAFFSVKVSDVPADDEHPFGHGKIENISGVVEAILIFFAAAYIIYEAVRKIAHPEHGMEPTLGIVVMFISAVANYLISGLLFKVAKKTDSVALEADGHHLRVDVWTSGGVFVGLGLIKLTGWQFLDPIVAILVAILIIKVAYDLTREAGKPLVDSRLPKHEVDRVREILRSNTRIIGFHKLRTRKAGAHRHIDVHLIVPENLTVAQAHSMAEDVEHEIRAEFKGAQVVTHVEPDTEDNLSKTPPDGFTESARSKTSKQDN